MTWPLAWGLDHLSRTSSSGDARYSVWNVAWVAHALVNDPQNLFDANIFHPHADTLAYSEANLGAGVLAAPVLWLTGSPLIAFNTVVLFSFAASIVATWLLVRRLTRDDTAAATSAVLFAFCPYVFAHTNHIQLLTVAGLPLAMLMLHRLVDAPSPRAGVALGVALAAQALSCAYYGIFAGLMVGVATVFYASSRRTWTSGRYWLPVGIAATISIALVLPFLLPYLELQRETGFGRSLDDARPYSAYFRSYLASAAHAHAWMLPFIKDWNHEVLFPGFLAIALAAAGIGATFGAARQEPESSRLRETALLYGIVGILAFWTSLGPRGGLYTILYHVIPVFSLLRAPGRTGIVVVLCLAVLAGFGVHLLRRTFARHARAIGMASCLAALAELNLLPFPWRETVPPPDPYRVLARLPRGAVAEFPFFDRRIDFHLHSIYMLNSTAHWQPLVNGYSDHIPKEFRDLARAVGGFPSRESFDALRRRRVRYITVHRNLYGRQDAADVERRLPDYAPYLRLLAEDDRMMLFEVVAWPR